MYLCPQFIKIKSMILEYLLAQYDIFLIVMAVLAVIVFISLNFIEVGYGITINKKWGDFIGKNFKHVYPN
jgi:hypothetical protein